MHLKNATKRARLATRPKGAGFQIWASITMSSWSSRGKPRKIITKHMDSTKMASNLGIIRDSIRDNKLWTPTIIRERHPGQATTSLTQAWLLTMDTPIQDSTLVWILDKTRFQIMTSPFTQSEERLLKRKFPHLASKRCMPTLPWETKASLSRETQLLALSGTGVRKYSKTKILTRSHPTKSHIKGLKVFQSMVLKSKSISLRISMTINRLSSTSLLLQERRDPSNHFHAA